MKVLSFVLIASFATLSLQAQNSESKDYRKVKEEITEKVFGTPDPNFKENKLPDQYKNESAVILAQKHTLESDSKMKYRWAGTAGAKFSFYEIFRRKIYINDQSALTEYSELTFNKLQSKYSGMIGKKKNYTFINIRLIKPNGTTRNIDVDESAVTVKDEKNKKENKIAIPDLSVGDVLDYYIAGYYQEDAFDGSSTLSYVFGDDYPIITYAISLQFDKRIAVLYQHINGAPAFKVSPDADGDGNVMNMVVSNIPKMKGLMWSSLCRQVPIIRIKYNMGNITMEGTDIRAGIVAEAPRGYGKMKETALSDYLSNLCATQGRATSSYHSYRETAKKLYTDYIAKHPRANNPDSLIAFVYRFITWNDNYTQFDLETAYNNAYFPLDLNNQLYRIVEFAYIMKLEFKTNVDLVIVSGTNSYTRDNIFSEGDLSLLVKNHDGKPQYFSFEDNFNYDNTFPYNFQGQQAISIPFDSHGKWVTVPSAEGTTLTLPTGTDKDNAEHENIMVSIDQSDPQLLDVSRQVSARGYMKKDEQAALTIYEEMALQTGKDIEKTDDLLTQNKNRSKSQRASEDELKSLIDKARANHKEDFENDIERNYDVKAKQVSNFKITNFGTMNGAPFEFEESFTMDGWLKKAGNNYIMDFGKLISSQLEIKQDQRERTKDIYMPFARSFNYRIEFTVPAGYTADGVDKLNMNLENETGGFVSKAKTESNKIIVDIYKHYSNSFEQAAKWPSLVSFLDKALDFNQQKILLKKI